MAWILFFWLNAKVNRGMFEHKYWHKNALKIFYFEKFSEIPSIPTILNPIRDKLLQDRINF